MTVITTQTSQAQTESNRRFITETFEAWRDGTDALPHAFAPELVFRIEGRSAASKEYTSKQNFIQEFAKPFGARFSKSEPFRPVRIRSVHADGDMVIVLWDGRGVATDGQPYENTYAFFMTLRDGKVVAVTSLLDSISLNDLWERVQPGG